MTTFELGNLFYLVLLTSAIAFWFFTSNRQGFGKTLQQAVLWALIFLGVIAVIGLWEDISSTVMPQQAIITDKGKIEILRGQDGHFRLTLDVNSVPVTFMVDTGATDIVLSKQDASRVGFNPEDLPYYERAMTANGEVRTAPIRLSKIALGQFEDRGIPASVNEGRMGQSLLGMMYLKRFEKITISGNKMILTR